jgi:hypothetical protein
MCSTYALIRRPGVERTPAQEDAELEKPALGSEQVKGRIEGREIAMIKVVPNRLVNVALK